MDTVRECGQIVYIQLLVWCRLSRNFSTCTLDGHLQRILYQMLGLWRPGQIIIWPGRHKSSFATGLKEYQLRITSALMD